MWAQHGPPGAPTPVDVDEVLDGPVVDDLSGSSFGRRAFIAGAAGAAAGTAVSTLGLPQGVAGAAVEPGASYFTPVDPQRLCDTRSPSTGVGFSTVGTRTIRVKVAGAFDVPDDAIAAVLTVTAVNRTNGGIFVTAYPAGESRPVASNLNCGFYDERVANLATVKLSSTGFVDIYYHGPAYIVVDVAGVYRPTSSAVSAGRFVSVAPVIRALDTRRTGQRLRAGGTVRCNLNGLVSSSAIAVVANLTAVNANAQGFVQAVPAGAPTGGSSNLNPAAGDNRAVGILTKLNTVNGVRGIDIFSSKGCDIVVDVAGYITGPNDPSSDVGLFVPMSPYRVLDTRKDRQRLWPGWTRAVGMPSPISNRAQAVSANLTVTQTMNQGYFTLLAAQTRRQEVSNINAMRPGHTLANHAIASISSKGLSCYSHKGGHIVIDLSGWFTGSASAVTTSVPYNPPPPGISPPWLINVPGMGLASWVYEGSPDPIVDAGNSWHWTGTGNVGQGAAIAVFGHRTEAGGPYRNQHFLSAGQRMTARTADNRLYTYEMVAEYITSEFANDILGATRRIGGQETMSLVACTLPNRLPTSLRWRIISTFRVIGWEDLG
ncbi:MAG: sortase [Actinomycetota bacterium]